MKPTSRPFPGTAALAAALLVLAGPAPGQDSAAQGAQPGAKAGTSGQSDGGSQAAAEPAGGASTGARKPAPVCFKLTGRCVEPASRSSTAAGQGAKSASDGTSAQSTTSAPGAAPSQSGGPNAASNKTLNLTAPDVRSVVPADDLKEPLPSDEQITETQEAGTVAVKADKELAEVPLGFGALWWALNHPSQAWRILTPVE